MTTAHALPQFIVVEGSDLVRYRRESDGTATEVARISGTNLLAATEHPEFSVAICNEDGLIAAGLKDGEWLPSNGTGPAPDPDPIIIPEHTVDFAFVEPYEDPSSNLMLTWISDTPDARLCAFRPTGGGFQFQLSSARTRSYPALSGKYLHTAVITGLVPGTVYECAFPGASFTDTFRTCSSSNIKIAVISDHQSINNEGTTAQIGGLATAEGIDLLFVPGDHVNDDGVIDQTSSQNWFDYLEMINTLYRRDGALVPQIYAIGNHEGINAAGTGSADNQGTGTPGQIGDLLSWSYWEDHPTRFNRSAATFGVGTELFVIQLETDHTVPLPGEQTTWLLNQIVQAYPVYNQIMIVGHAPAFYPSFGPRQYRVGQAHHMRTVIYPALAQYADKINCYMCGHAHVMAASDRLQMDIDPNLGSSQEDREEQSFRWFVDQTEGIRQLGTGPVQASTTRPPERAADISVIDASEMLVAAMGTTETSGATIATHGTLENTPQTPFHFWVLEVDGQQFAARAIDAENTLLWQMTETLPAYA